jgi:hypothetical protein
MGPVRASFRSPILAGFVALILAASLLPTAWPAQAVASKIYLRPSSGKAGDRIQVTAVGFPSGASGDLIWSATGASLGRFTTAAGGRTSTTFTVPDAQSGDYDVLARAGSVEARASFRVTNSPPPAAVPPTPTPSPTAIPPTPTIPAPTPTEVPPTPTDPVPTPTEAAQSPTPTEAVATSTSSVTTTSPTVSAASPTPTADGASSPEASPEASPQINNAVAGSELVVAINGSDTNPGTSGAPLKTLQRALDLAQPGMTITLIGGTHTLSATATSKRSGTAAAPITIRSAPGQTAVLSGPGSSRGVQINHDWYVITGLEFSGADILLWLDGAEHVLITGNRFHDAGGECVRIKNQSRYNTFRSNSVWSCGLEGFNLASGSKNGEGVYIGTAPEQRYKIGGVPDYSTDNVVEYNTFQTNASEAVDIKEDSERNIVRYNVGSNNRDPDGANFGSRGDYNTFVGNESFGSAGAGFRTGGDTVDGRVYGKNNILRGNSSHDNALHGYKFMVSPQDADCSNTGSNNGGKLYYFGNGTFPVPCGDSGSATQPSPTPATATPTPTPTAAAGTGPNSSTQMIFIATADARVRADEPTKNYGGEKSVRVDSDPDTDSYLTFAVTGAGGRTIASARIRVYVTESGKAGVSCRSVLDTTWGEQTIVYNNRPQPSGPALGTTSATVTSGSWVEFDVTTVVRGNGVFSFVIGASNTDGVAFASRESGSRAPQLVVTYAA